MSERPQRSGGVGTLASLLSGRRALIVGLALVLLLGVAIAMAAGSGGTQPDYTPSGAGVASVITQHAAPPKVHKAHVPSFRPDPVATATADKLPIERQVAQLFLVNLNGQDAGAIGALGNTDWGGVLVDSSNFVNDTQISSLAGQELTANRTAGRTAPLLAATQEGGQHTAFTDAPPRPQTEIDTAAAAHAEALSAGKRLATLGFNMTLAPLADVDVSQGALSGRLFGSSPHKVARLAKAAVSGYGEAGVVSAVGHFPGAGGASADPDQSPATVGGSRVDLAARDLIPFEALAPIAPVIMLSNASYAAFDGVTPASLSRDAVRLLRHEIGFQGTVMSDDLDATLQATGQDIGASAIQALKAGVDLIYVSGPPNEQRQAYDALRAAAQGSASLRARVHDALLHVLTLKARFGILK